MASNARGMPPGGGGDVEASIRLVHKRNLNNILSIKYSPLEPKPLIPSMIFPFKLKRLVSNDFYLWNNRGLDTTTGVRWIPSQQKRLNSQPRSQGIRRTVSFCVRHRTLS